MFFMFHIVYFIFHINYVLAISYYILYISYYVLNEYSLVLVLNRLSKEVSQ
jgi:hypothetical protein